MDSDISRLKDVLSKVSSTEKALNEFTRSSDVNGIAVSENLVKLREFISEAKATLNDAASGYDSLVHLS
jgi:hypothetical protein